MTSTPTTKRMREEGDSAQKDGRLAKRIITISDFDNTVTVIVGPEEQRFTIHQELICAKSRLFKAACSKHWLEGQERVVRLPEAKAVTFKVYSSWVYSEDIADLTCTEMSSMDSKRAEHAALIDLYLLGDILDDILLRDRTRSLLFSSMRN